MRKVNVLSWMILTFAMTMPAMAQHHHEGDFIIGRTGAGALAVEFDFAEHLHLDETSASSPFDGWAGNEPGFDSLGSDEPAEDFYTLAAGHNINIVFSSIPGAFKIYDGSLSLVTGTYNLGSGTALHTHLTWLIDETDPLFDSTQDDWELEFYFQDIGTTGYTNSPTYTATFTNEPIPEPATMGLLMVGTAGLLAKRRRKTN